MSAERFTLDTNLLVYFLDSRDPVRHGAAIELVSQAVRCDCRLTAQALAEFFAVAIRKLRLRPAEAAAQVRDWMVLFPVDAASPAALDRALTEAEAGRFSFWDAMLLAAAEEAGCTLCLSEDMQDGARLGNLTVRSPFAEGGLSEAARRLLG